MAENRVAELRRFVSAITQPHIRPFIDLKKLCSSGTYNLAVQMAIEHAVEHGDFAYLNSLMTLVDGSSHASDLIATCRPRLTFVVTGDKPRKLKKATADQALKATKLASSKTPSVATSRPSPTKKPAKKSSVSQDLLDSRLMLPGSFGHGKRR